MRRRRRKRDVLAVSLFPFLAVLICTLGVLIVLLVLAVKSTDDKAVEAQQASDTELRTQLDQLTLGLDARMAQVDGLQLVRPEAVQRLTDSRSTRHHLEAELKRLEQESIELAETLLRLEQQESGQQEESSVEVNDAELAELAAEIDDARKKLQVKRDQAKDVGPATYAIVPHQGVGGTFRRPIFVECREREIVLQPHGIVLQQADFLPPLFPGNMLDAALLTVRNYWSKYDLDGDEGKAYPLLVVRPGGAETYTAARHAMKSWDDEFGYELVESNKTLDFGPRDAQLAAEVQAAVDRARPLQLQLAERQRRRLREQRLSARNVRKSERRPGLTVSGSQGGFVANGYESDTDASEFGRGDSVDRFAGQGTNERSGFAGERRKFDSENATGSGAREFSANDTDDNSFVSTSSGQFGSESNDSAPNPQGGNSNASKSTSSGNGQQPSAQSREGQQSQSLQGQPPGEAGDSASSGQCLANSRGSGWALPTKTPGATAYVRPVRVVCHPDYLTVRNGSTERRVFFEGSTAQAVDPLVDEIWRQIESWGSAGARGYWKPELRMTVLPGASDRFRTLQGLLHRSGLVLEQAKEGAK